MNKTSGIKGKGNYLFRVILSIILAVSMMLSLGGITASASVSGMQTMDAKSHATSSGGSSTGGSSSGGSSSIGSNFGGSGSNNSGSGSSGISSSSSSSGSGQTIQADGTVTIAVGHTATLDGTHNSMASSESWTSNNTSIATVKASGESNDSDATVTGVSAGTATITHTISSLFGSSTETFTVIVTGESGSDGSGTGGGSGSGGSGSSSGSGSGKDVEPGDPYHVKSITPDGTVANYYNISLNVTGQSKTTTSTTTGETTTAPYDILLVLDNTTSMQGSYGSTTRLAAMKEAAKTFVSGLPASDSSKIAMISFKVGNYESPTTVDVNWTALNPGKNNVTSAINGLTAPNVSYGYDTCFTQPLERASSIMETVAGDGNKKYVVFFTDGAAGETVSTITSLAGNVKNKADATFSIGITSSSYNSDAEKAQALASSSGNYYDVTSAGTMGTAFSKALQTITTETTVTKVPMTGVVITDILSEYVDLAKPDTTNNGVSLESSDRGVTVKSVLIEGKTVTVSLKGNLTDGTVYTVKIPVKPSEKAHTEANEAKSSPSKFPSNDSASLIYQYGTEAAKTTPYKETPQITVAKQYTLTYNANAGDEIITVPESQKTDADGKVTISSEKPSRNGYAFLGWSTDSSATDADAAYSANTEVTLTADTTLYAVWHINTYTVTFDVQDHGTAPDAQTVEHSKVAAKPGTDPSETGYTFGGWYTDADCTTEYDFTTPVTADTTVYAKWTPEEYTITYNLDGGSLAVGVTNPGTYTIESDDITLSNPTKEGYTFTGWTGKDLDAAAKEVTIAKGSTGDRTYTATWEAAEASYTVRHYLQNLENNEYTERREDAQTLTGKIGEQTVAEAKTYEGFTMVYLEQKTIPASGSTTVPVYYDRNKHTVTYTVTGDAPSDSAAPASGTYKYGASVSAADNLTTTQTTKGDLQGTWTFSGWTTSDAAVADNAFTMPDKNVAFTGSWTFTQNPQPQPQPDPSYTIDTRQKSHTYEIYQIFTGNYTEKDGKAILTEIVWGENGKSDDKTNPAVIGQPVPESIVNALKALTGGEVEPSDKAKLAEIEKYVNMSHSTNYPKTIKSENGEQVKITDLPAGYYLIKDKDGSQTGQDDSYTLYITQIVKDYTIKPKSVKPTVDKQVSDDDGGDTTSAENATNKNAADGWYESADHAIGETFQFRLIATLPASTHYADYSTYKLVFTDTMSAGVTFESIASVSVNGTAVPESGYIVSGVNASEAGKTWTLTINDVKSVQSDISSGAVVTVVYNAHLNENATAHKASADPTDTNKNMVSLQYSNNPNTNHGEDMGQTASDTVWVFTYEVDNTKKKNSADGDALPGAGFRLYDSNESEIALTYNGTKGAYLPAAAGSNGVEMKSGSDGKFNIIGLDAGTYTLKETTTPSGYNKCSDTTITISASHSENNDTTTAKLDLGSSNTDNTIINNSGSVLPSTGGIGTTIFYMLGVLLTVGAGIVLITRRRMRVE